MVAEPIFAMWFFLPFVCFLLWPQLATLLIDTSVAPIGAPSMISDFTQLPRCSLTHLFDPISLFARTAGLLFPLQPRQLPTAQEQFHLPSDIFRRRHSSTFETTFGTVDGLESTSLNYPFFPYSPLRQATKAHCQQTASCLSKRFCDSIQVCCSDDLLSVSQSCTLSFIISPDVPGSGPLA